MDSTQVLRETNILWYIYRHCPRLKLHCDIKFRLYCSVVCSGVSSMFIQLFVFRTLQSKQDEPQHLVYMQTAESWLALLSNYRHVIKTQSQGQKQLVCMHWCGWSIHGQETGSQRKTEEPYKSSSHSHRRKQAFLTAQTHTQTHKFFSTIPRTLVHNALPSP